MEDFLDRVRLEDLDGDAHLLAQTVGMEAFCAIVRAFGGWRISVPAAKTLTRAARDAQIQREYTGYNLRHLSRKYGLGEGYIRSLMLKKRADIPGQERFF